MLRFNVAFPTSFPQSGPTIRFDSDVFHRKSANFLNESYNYPMDLHADLVPALVDPKTKIWKPHGRISRWQWVRLCLVAYTSLMPKLLDLGWITYRNSCTT